MNNRGQWYLVYTFMHDSDVRIGGYDSYATFEYEKNMEILLVEAKTKNKAILEAKTRWTEILTKANVKWEKIKKTWQNPDMGPPKTAFGGANPNPHIIYKIRL